jgi:hypothetical protein
MWNKIVITNFIQLVNITKNSISEDSMISLLFHECLISDLHNTPFVRHNSKALKQRTNDT